MLKEKSQGVYREIMAMGSPREVGEKFLLVRLKLFEKSYMHTLLHGLHAWHITPDEMMKVEQVQTKFLKMILGLPPSTPTAALYMELGVWPVRERLEYLTFMLYQDLARRNEGVASSIVQSDEMKEFPNFIVERAKRTMISLGKTSIDPRSKDKQEWAKIVEKDRNTTESRDGW